ncbi:putative prolyl oligopeptidase, putative,serine peptidase clan SC, family S9A [Trypanosoma grayi]|uniref:putative prolyl oligopeptidase, putative,serine peptidase clan SC, family S9A n=1 Tax=Trypanosoma grayi TaxID=71804 RepID=UPI0004F47861|nr:putative prolyl oligopeptidase, putative,serine peptidase clan SC, family S9A [Trypanosoma grayi]KEG15414.1 putative prolyl oligopeptidase, putative,serine peptidase clan SC, family S9A [Trypanosoma grayi]
MSGENIYNLIDAVAPVVEGPYTGKYEKHMKEIPKPAYSTFTDKKKEYDGTHPRYFKQRDAVMGPIVNDSVDPKNFLRAGEGVKYCVPPSHEKKIFTKPTLDHGAEKLRNGKGLGRQAHLGGAFPENTKIGRNSPLDGSCNGEGSHTQEQRGPCGNNTDRNETQEGLGGSGAPGNARTKDDGVFPRSSGGLEQGHNGGAGNYPGGHETTGDDSLRVGNTADAVYALGALDGKKDFVTSNIIQMNNMVPKRRKDQPEHPTSRKTFAQVPNYLGRVKKEIDDEKMHFKAIEEAQICQRQQQLAKFVYRLDEKERVELINNLKKKLNDKSSELNKMPFVKDTFTQVKRRAELERDIKEIESALVKLDKDAIFVYKDDPRFVGWTKDAALEEARRFASQPKA